MAVLGFISTYTDRATPGLGRLGATYERLKLRVNTLTGAIDQNSRTLTRMGLGLGVASFGLFAVYNKLGAVWKKSVDEAQKFEVAEKNLRYALGLSAKTAENDAKMQGVRNEAFKIGADTLYSATEAAQAWYNLVSFGLSGSTKMFDQHGNSLIKQGKHVERNLAEIATRATLDFATMSAGTVSLDEAASFAGQIVNKLGLDLSRIKTDEAGNEMNQLSRAMDKMARATILTGFQVRDLPIAFRSMRSVLGDLNMDLETSLAMTGIWNTLGLEAADAGHMMVSLGRKTFQFAGKALRQEMEAAIGVGKGGKGNMRAKRRDYWVNKVFGSPAEMNKALQDARGDVGNLIDFYAKIQDYIEKKYGKEGAGLKKGAFLQQFFGEVQSMQGFQMLAKYKFVTDKDIYQVDEWGEKVKDAKGNWIKLAEANKEFTGFKAVQMMAAAIKDSAGEARTYAKMMEESSWGLKKLQEGVRQTFMILVGEHVLPILNKFYKALYWVFNRLSDFARTHPYITKVAVVFGLVATAVIGVGAVLAGLIAMFSFMSGQLVRVVTGLKATAASYFLVAKGAASATASTAAYNAANMLGGKGTAAKGASSATDILTTTANVGTMAKGSVFARMWSVIVGWISRAGKLIVSLGPKLLRVAKIGGIVAAIAGIIYGAFEMVKKNVWGIGDAFVAVGNWFKTYIVQPIMDFVDTIRRFLVKIRFILMALFTDEVYAEDVRFLGAESLDLIDMLNNGFFKFIRSIIVFFRYIGDAIDKVKKLFDFMGEGMGEMSMMLGGVGALIGTAVAGPLGAVVGGLIGLLVGGLVAAIVNVVRNWDTFKERMVTFVKEIPDLLYKAWQVLKDGFFGLVEWLAEKWSNFVQGLPGPVRFVIDVIETIVLGIAAVIGWFVSMTFKAIKGFIGLVVKIPAGAKALVRGVVSAFTAVATFFEDIFKTIGKTVLGFFSWIWSKIKDTAFGKFLSGVGSALTKSLGAAWSALSSIGGAIYDQVASGFDSAWTVVKRLVDQLGEWMSIIWEKIKAGFYSVIAVLYKARLTGSVTKAGQAQYGAEYLGYSMRAEVTPSSKAIKEFAAREGINVASLVDILQDIKRTGTVGENGQRVMNFNFPNMPASMTTDELHDLIQKLFNEAGVNLYDYMDEFRVNVDRGADRSKTWVRRAAR